MMRKGKGYTVYTILTTLGEEAALAAIVLLGLPLLGINIPWWGLVLMMAVVAACSYITYWLCQRTLHKKATVGPETLIGAKGKATCQIAPEGYVRVEGELWKAVSAGIPVDVDEEVIVVGRDELTLVVTLLTEDDKSTYNYP
jgi:membrane-bound ClpP family serine protease